MSANDQASFSCHALWYATPVVRAVTCYRVVLGLLAGPWVVVGRLLGVADGRSSNPFARADAIPFFLKSSGSVVPSICCASTFAAFLPCRARRALTFLFSAATTSLTDFCLPGFFDDSWLSWDFGSAWPLSMPSCVAFAKWRNTRPTAAKHQPLGGFLHVTPGDGKMLNLVSSGVPQYG